MAKKNVYLIRREVFAASHRLYEENLSPEENQKLFGKCANKNGHGHNYVLEVTVKGEVSEKNGMVLNISELKKIIRSEIISQVDHKHLNLDVTWLKNINPTSENVVIAFWEKLENSLPQGTLNSLKLYETENNFVEYRG